MRGYVAVLLAGILIFGAIASGCISPEKPTTPEKVEVSLTGDFVKDAVNIGKALESSGVNEVKFTVWGLVTQTVL